MFKRFKSNPLFSFISRIFFIIITFSIFWIVGIFYYYESQMAEKIHNNIMTVKMQDIELFKKVDFEKQNQIYFDFLEIIDKESKKSELIHVEFFDEKEQKVFSKKFSSYPKEVNFFLKTLNKIEKELEYSLIPISSDEAYFYYQNKIQLGDELVYFNSLKKLDKKYIESIEKETYFAILMVIITVLVLSSAIFPIVYSQYKNLIDNKNDLVISNLNTLVSLGNAMSKRDSDTNEHNYRVTYYSLVIAQAMNLKNDLIESLIKGAFLHDIGKIAISDNILLKPGKLTSEEFEIMKTHVVHGVDIVKNISWLEDAQNVILYHHEKVDGTGYPNKIKKDDIPIEARIFAIADVFDALTSKRPYKKPFSIEKSIEIIKKDAGTHFDPAIVKVFEKLYEKAYLDVADKNFEELKELFETLLEPYFIKKF